MKSSKNLRPRQSAQGTTTGPLRAFGRVAAIALLFIAFPAHADRGALSVDLGGGAAGVFLPATFADPPKTQFGSAFHIRLGVRYAVLNWLEVTSSAFFDPPVTYFHNGVTV